MNVWRRDGKEVGRSGTRGMVVVPGTEPGPQAARRLWAPLSCLAPLLPERPVLPIFALNCLSEDVEHFRVWILSVLDCLVNATWLPMGALLSSPKTQTH